MERYTTRKTMSAEKTVAISFRVSPRFKQLLEAAATRALRSQTNMLETLLFAHCEQEGIEAMPTALSAPAPLPAKKKVRPS